MKKVIIIGAGGHGKEVAWTLAKMKEAGAQLEVLGFCDDKQGAGSHIMQSVVLGSIEAVALHHGDGLHYICAVGANAIRPELVRRAEQVGWKPVSVIHPAAIISADVHIGPGAYVAAGAYVGPSSRIGAHALVNVLSSVGHDAEVGEFAQVCPGAKLSGGCRVGAGAFVGSNAVIAPGKSVGPGCTVSATVLVAMDIPAGMLVIGGIPKCVAVAASSGGSIV